MDVNVKQSSVQITIEITPDELTELDTEFNELYAMLGEKIKKYPKVWELKDKLNIAYRG